MSHNEMVETKWLWGVIELRIFKLWCLVASGGLDFFASSTSFQKSYIGWPQQPLTERTSDIIQKLYFDYSLHKKGLILVILVPGMIPSSGWGKILRKQGCWGQWGCRGWWGQWGSKGFKRLKNHHWRLESHPVTL